MHSYPNPTIAHSESPEHLDHFYYPRCILTHGITLVEPRGDEVRSSRPPIHFVTDSRFVFSSRRET